MQEFHNELRTGADIQLPSGFSFAGYRGGIKKDKLDTAVIVSQEPSNCAAVFTRNKVRAHCVVRNEKLVDRRETVKGIIVNSGNANACTGEEGEGNNERFAAAAAQHIGCKSEQILTASTGVIGVQLPIAEMEHAAGSIETGSSGEHFLAAVDAIMTTDTRRKCVSCRFIAGGSSFTITGMAKGSGMIHPNMGTMLGFIVTDAPISAPSLQSSLKLVVDETFNMISVDGDTSTNDMVLLLCPPGDRGRFTCEQERMDFLSSFHSALYDICRYLAVEIARDGEGATKLLRCRVEGASSLQNARTLAKGVIGSSLVKCAFFGEDANWGRIIAAMGYSGADFNQKAVSISFRNFDGTRAITLMKRGTPVVFSEEEAKKILSQQEIEIFIGLEEGSASATAWGCDLTYDYVKINGDYRT